MKTSSQFIRFRLVKTHAVLGCDCRRQDEIDNEALLLEIHFELEDKQDTLWDRHARITRLTARNA